MGSFVRHAGTFAADLSRYTLRTGRWWFPVVLLLLAAGAFVALTAKVVVPTAVYVLF